LFEKNVSKEVSVGNSSKHSSVTSASYDGAEIKAFTDVFDTNAADVVSVSYAYKDVSGRNSSNDVTVMNAPKDVFQRYASEDVSA
jgi:hypothetical protein